MRLRLAADVAEVQRQHAVLGLRVLIPDAVGARLQPSGMPRMLTLASVPEMRPLSEVPW